MMLYITTALIVCCCVSLLFHGERMPMSQSNTLTPRGTTVTLDMRPSAGGLSAEKAMAACRYVAQKVIDKPSRCSDDSAECGEHVRSFLSEVKRYFVVTGLPVADWGV